jgi:hypothetical protein
MMVAVGAKRLMLGTVLPARNRVDRVGTAGAKGRRDISALIGGKAGRAGSGAASGGTQG